MLICFIVSHWDDLSEIFEKLISFGFCDSTVCILSISSCPFLFLLLNIFFLFYIKNLEYPQTCACALLSSPGLFIQCNQQIHMYEDDFAPKLYIHVSIADFFPLEYLLKHYTWNLPQIKLL